MSQLSDIWLLGCMFVIVRLLNKTDMFDWDDFDMHEDDEDYIESLKRKQQEQQLTTGQNTTNV